MSNSLVLSDCFLVALAKSKRLLNLDQLIDFLEHWHRIVKHTKEIFICPQKNSFLLNDNLDLVFPFKIEQKAFFQALRHFKKPKNMDNLLVAKEAQIVFLRNQWLIARRKAILKTKTPVKKAANAEKKLIKKQNKACE